MAVAPVLPWRKASGELLRAPPVLAGLGRRRHAGASPCCSAPAGLAPAAGLRARRLRRRLGRCASSCWPPAARAGGASSAGPTAAWSCTSAWSSSPWPSPPAAASCARPSSRSRPARAPTFAGHTLTYEGQQVKQRGRQDRQPGARSASTATGPWGPSLNQFTNGSQTIGTPSVRTDLARRRLPLAHRGARGRRRRRSRIRVIVQPLVVWLWIGGARDGLRHGARRLPGPAPQPHRPRVGPAAGLPGRAPSPADPDGPDPRRRPRAPRRARRSPHERHRRRPRRVRRCPVRRRHTARNAAIVVGVRAGRRSSPLLATRGHRRAARPSTARRPGRPGVQRRDHRRRARSTWPPTGASGCW